MTTTTTFVSSLAFDFFFFFTLELDDVPRDDDLADVDLADTCLISAAEEEEEEEEAGVVVLQLATLFRLVFRCCICIDLPPPSSPAAVVVAAVETLLTSRTLGRLDSAAATGDGCGRVGVRAAVAVVDNTVVSSTRVVGNITSDGNPSRARSAARMMVGSDILRSTVAADKVDDDGIDGSIAVVEDDVKKTRFAASAMRTLDDFNSRAAMLLLSMASKLQNRRVT